MGHETPIMGRLGRNLPEVQMTITFRQVARALGYLLGLFAGLIILSGAAFFACALVEDIVPPTTTLPWFLAGCCFVGTCAGLLFGFCWALNWLWDKNPSITIKRRPKLPTARVRK